MNSTDIRASLCNNTAGGSNVCRNASFIMTVLNEESSITGFLESLFKQEVMPSEIIIIDGGSKDKTPDLIAGYFKNIIKTQSAAVQENRSGIFKIKAPHFKVNIVKLFDGISKDGIRLAAYTAAGAGISQGRNIAIELSRSDFLCVSDAGCRLECGWINEIVKSFKQNHQPAEVVGGITLPCAENFTQACLAVCMLPLAPEINEKTFMPSSRNAGFSRSAWENAGRYPEYMDFGEDMKFNFNLKNAGYRIKFNPHEKVYWNLRDNPAAVFKQFFRYAKGDAIGRMYPIRHIIRISSLLMLAATLALASFVSPYFIFLLVFLFAAYCYRPYSRINYIINDKKTCPFVFRGRSRLFSKTAIAAGVPFMLLYIDTAKLAGYFYGLFKRKTA